jgi:hypothetical protein
MSKPKKRDSAYYRKRLKDEHPHIYAGLLADKFPSVRAASLKAGLIHLPSSFVVLKREWGNASAKDREEFKDWISGTKPTSPTPASLVDEDGFLTIAAIEEIERIMKAKRMKDADLMEELGFNRHAPSWGRVKPGRSRWKPKKELLDALERFLRDHRA